MSTPFDFANFGNMFGGMQGGTPTGLDALLSEDQRKLMGRNATLAAAAALLQAGGRSTTPIGLGQALGSALQAGQQGYTQARAGSVQDLMVGEKLKEAQRAAMADADFLKFIQGQGGAPAAPIIPPAMPQVMPPEPLTGVAVPPVERFVSETMPVRMPPPMAAAPAAAPSIFSGLSQEQLKLIGSLGRDKGVPELLRMSSAASEFGEARPVVIDGRTVMVQTNKLGQNRIAPNMMPYEALSPDIRAVEYLTGQPLAGTGPAGTSKVGEYRQQIATKVDVKPVIDMTGGQAGFTNLMAIGSKFKAEPIYKDFSDMETAYSQVVSSLKQGTPIGDVAGATKVMKLLDPGSVVRESELGIAMAAGGRMDRLQNYFSNMLSGQKLTPTQRDDFERLSNELYAAAGQAYNKKRAEYQQFGEAYGFKNLDTVLGAPATVPSIMRKPQPGPDGAPQKRKNLNDIFGG
jgi:hypothetical protein